MATSHYFGKKSSLLRRNKLTCLFGTVKKAGDVINLTSNRTIMTSRVRLEKAVQELQRNPYFDKYAQKIAKLQQTSPEEFLQRIEEKAKKEKEQKVFCRCLKYSQKLKRFWSLSSHLWCSNMDKNRSMFRAYSQATNELKYITTPIFYVNAVPHIGHLYTAVVSDCIARYNLMQGHVTFLNTGTDEHGNKVEQAAKLLNMPVDTYCDKVSSDFREMCDDFEVGYTNFIRTTDAVHKATVHYFWKLLEEKNYIYKGKYSGWYCVPEEAFLSNQDLIEKKTSSGKSVKVSAESGHVVEWTEEDNYKFRLSSFQDDLKHWLKDVFYKIVTQWIEEGSCLTDLSVSRPISRAPWGIPTPSDPNQTVYVWMDALVNYLSSLGYPQKKYKEFWPPTTQIIGKDILKFHGVYWPAFLIAAGLEPPKTLYCHSHWTVNGEKMSKSKGNVIKPFDAAEKFTIEGLRYFLLRESVPHNDSDYNEERALNVLNSELADTLGNLVSRCTGKVLNPKSEIPSAAIYCKVLKSEPAEQLRYNMESLGNIAKGHYESLYIHHAIDAVMTTLRSANIMVDYHKPWILRKEINNVVAMTELKSVIALAMETTRISALCLYPVVPKLSTNLLDFLNIPMDNRFWKDTAPKYLSPCAPVDSKHFGHTNIIVFPKIKSKS
ncbi:methionine--tRNA ligase, mitochondrial-like isoform X2 [Phymastichus coffea]|uniref:methionine--tRNA ligase, mitochondrial-like isoform X2 n=1 Tax=Phymastichus coffea TaxID=108790 RepID=UPI00273CC1CC|nr:methionine--tRNA ligase, mitochondrial-like isoform X2 [Phymastichus coffea]